MSQLSFEPAVALALAESYPFGLVGVVTGYGFNLLKALLKSLPSFPGA